MYPKRAARAVFARLSHCTFQSTCYETRIYSTAVSAWTKPSEQTRFPGLSGVGFINNISPGRKRHIKSSAFTFCQTTLDPAETKKFQEHAGQWWDEQGKFAALHSMNDLRVPFIRDHLLNVQGDRSGGKPLFGVGILDVGCGGGILTERLARLGAHVIGIDPVEDSISAAELHCSCDPSLKGRIQYRVCTLETLLEENSERFDALVASEIVEHLVNLDTFIKCCHQALKPGGSLFITTINKTNLSYALGIVVAENILQIVPKETHDWNKFICPVDLECALESNGFSVQSIRGMLYNPLSGAWSWMKSTDLNYALYAIKQPKDNNDERCD